MNRSVGGVRSSVDAPFRRHDTKPWIFRFTNEIAIVGLRADFCDHFCGKVRLEYTWCPRFRGQTTWDLYGVVFAVSCQGIKSYELLTLFINMCVLPVRFFLLTRFHSFFFRSFMPRAVFQVMVAMELCTNGALREALKLNISWALKVTFSWIFFFLRIAHDWYFYYPYKILFAVVPRK